MGRYEHPQKVEMHHNEGMRWIKYQSEWKRKKERKAKEGELEQVIV